MFLCMDFKDQEKNSQDDVLAGVGRSWTPGCLLKLTRGGEDTHTYMIKQASAVENCAAL